MWSFKYACYNNKHKLDSLLSPWGIQACATLLHSTEDINKCISSHSSTSGPQLIPGGQPASGATTEMGVSIRNSSLESFNLFQMTMPPVPKVGAWHHRQAMCGSGARDGRLEHSLPWPLIWCPSFQNRLLPLHPPRHPMSSQSPAMVSSCPHLKHNSSQGPPGEESPTVRHGQAVLSIHLESFFKKEAPGRSGSRL